MFFCSNSFAQQNNDTTIAKKQDTAARKNILSLDTSAKKYNPKVATFRSAVLPGWVDYSVLFFLIFWGLNVVDATVDAHLKAFDVNDNLSLKIKPGYNPYTNTGGLSFVFSFKDKQPKVLPSLR